ncbi:nucleoside triphosphate pyrophosphohydrolase, partial [Klebsiella pneumoniae]|nr:nucleoside triphosphate pyrophosphohydrolase [Klebsiella pneumoniae]
LQVVYHSQMAAEAGHFRLHDVIADITAKMISRHPHVFADAAVTSSAAQSDSWERMKAAERGAAGALDGVALALPALMRAHKLQKRAARTGFD